MSLEKADVGGAPGAYFSFPEISKKQCAVGTLALLTIAAVATAVALGILYYYGNTHVVHFIDGQLRPFFSVTLKNFFEKDFVHFFDHTLKDVFLNHIEPFFATTLPNAGRVVLSYVLRYKFEILAGVVGWATVVTGAAGIYSARQLYLRSLEKDAKLIQDRVPRPSIQE